jgi:hypothetical protein
MGEKKEIIQVIQIPIPRRLLRQKLRSLIAQIIISIKRTINLEMASRALMDR